MIALDDVRAGETEADWLAANEPGTLLQILGRRQVFLSPSTPRKLRLFCAACVRSVWRPDLDGRILVACETAELVAAGQGTCDDLGEARLLALRAMAHTRLVSFEGALSVMAATACDPRCAFGEETFVLACMTARQLGIAAADQAKMLRCLFADPYRAAAGDVFRSLRTSQGVVALGLAREFAQARRFEDLPFVAGALASAGVSQESELLRHLRGLERCAACLGSRLLEATDLPCPKCSGGGWLALPPAHVGGCWALDVLLGF